MRNLFFSFVGLISAFLVIIIMTAAAVSADTPVTVLSAGDLTIHLPVSPSVERIVADLHAELGVAADSELDPRIESALRRLESDKQLLQQVAASPVEMFDNGEAAATATAVYDVRLGSEVVIVTVITVELVPAYGSTARSRDHEDGHALINERIAKRCADDALRNGVEAGLQGQPLVNRIVAAIGASGDPVHDKYHEYVRNARYGQHIRYAQQALADVPGC